MRRILTTGILFTLAGVLGLRAVWARGQILMSHQEGEPAATRGGLGLLRLWFVIAISVAAQSAWILRPLVGEPNHAFALVMPRESNAFSGFVAVLIQLMS